MDGAAATDSEQYADGIARFRFIDVLVVVFKGTSFRFH